MKTYEEMMQRLSNVAFNNYLGGHDSPQNHVGSAADAVADVFEVAERKVQEDLHKLYTEKVARYHKYNALRNHYESLDEEAKKELGL